MLRQKHSLGPEVKAARPCAAQNGRWKNQLPRRTPPPSTPDRRSSPAAGQPCGIALQCCLKAWTSLWLEERGCTVNSKPRQNDEPTEEEAIHAIDLFALAADQGKYQQEHGGH